MIHHLVEKSIVALTTDGARTFFPPESFPWVAHLETNWRAIRRELDLLLTDWESIPNFQDLSADEKVLTEGQQWKTLFLYAYGQKADDNCARCPETTRLLALIPGMKTAMFSILAPGKHIPEHRGPWKGVLRYHLGLLVPHPSQCRLRVVDDFRSWAEGKSLIFDDSHPHEVWNDSSAHRVVLFVDFLRPLWFPLSLLNRFVVWRISKTPFVTDAMRRVRQAASRMKPANAH